MAVAEASFNTVKVSISFGLTSERGFDIPLMPSLSIASPSITINGSLLAFSEEPPRIRTVAPAPGAPPVDTTFTPAILPVIMSWGEVVIPLLILSGFMAVTEPVASSFFTCPYPITTTSSSSWLSSCSTTFILVAAGSSWVLYPMNEMTMMSP